MTKLRAPKPPASPGADFWGLKGYRCDSWPSLTHSGLCYRRFPLSVPPTLAGLFWMPSSNTTAADQVTPQQPPSRPDGSVAAPSGGAGPAPGAAGSSGSEAAAVAGPGAGALSKSLGGQEGVIADSSDAATEAQEEAVAAPRPS